MHARRLGTTIGDSARLFFCFSTIFALPGAILGTVAGVAFFGPKGLLQSAGLVKTNSDSVKEIALDSAKGVGKSALIGATAYPLLFAYPVYKAAEVGYKTVKNRM